MFSSEVFFSFLRRGSTEMPIVVAATLFVLVRFNLQHIDRQRPKAERITQCGSQQCNRFSGGFRQGSFQEGFGNVDN
jgi:hypothetical protein